MYIHEERGQRSGESGGKTSYRKGERERLKEKDRVAGAVERRGWQKEGT